MIQIISELVTFDEFIDWYPENSEHHYELHNGEIVEMPKATGKHSKLTGFLVADLNFEIRRLQLPYFIPKECVIKPISEESGYEPDIIVLNEQTIGNEPRWEKSSIITMGSSVPLIVEVTSTNWEDDCARLPRGLRVNGYSRILDCRLFRIARQTFYWQPQATSLFSLPTN
jgi:Uma2 family endonuclease